MQAMEPEDMTHPDEESKLIPEENLVVNIPDPTGSENGHHNDLERCSDTSHALSQSIL